MLPLLPLLGCSSCRRCPVALPPRSSLPLSCRRAPANTALLPLRCRRCPRVADSATTLPIVAAPLRSCSRCSASAATTLPPLTQPICHQVRAAPDGGKFTAFPPLVRRAPTAVPTAQDVRLDAERWGGVGGEAAAHGKSEIDGRKYEDGICPWFLRFLSSASVSLSLPWPKKGTGT